MKSNIVFVSNNFSSTEANYHSLPGMILAIMLIWVVPVICLGDEVSSKTAKSLVAKADQYFDDLDFEKAGEYYQKALNLIQSGGSLVDEASLRNKLTTVLWKTDELGKSASAGHESLQYCLDHFGWNHASTVDALINLGIISLLNQNNLSLMYLETASIIARRLFGEKHHTVATAMEWIGMTYDSYADSVNTRKYLYGSLKIWSQLYSSDDYHLAGIYRFIGLFHNRWGRIDSCHLFINRALLLNDRKYGINNIISANCLNNIANSYLESGNYDTMFYLSNQALKRLDQTPVYQRKVRSMALFNMADASEKSGNLQAALDYVTKALTLYYPKLSGLGVLANPDVQTIKNYPYSQLFFDFKRKILVNLRNSENSSYNETEIKLSINQLINIETALQDQLRSQLFLVEDILDYENLNSLKIWHMTHNKLHSTLASADTSNYTDVINLFIGSQRRIEFGINEYFADNNEKLPGSLAAQRHVLSEKITDLQRKLNAQKNEQDQLLIKENLLENKILLSLIRYKAGLIQQKLISFQQKPEYYYSTIIKALKPNQILFIFTQTKPTPMQTEGLYALVITSDKLFGLTHLKLSSFLKSVNTFNRLMTERNSQRGLDSIGYQIYKALFEPYQSYLKDREVIILPAGKLEKIPMDILMTEPTLQRRFLENNLVYNIMSLDVILEKRQIPNYESNESILAIAPSFNNERSKELSILTKRDERLIDLPFAREECDQISKIFETRILEGSNVYESIFKSLAGRFPILHLSTHGISDNGVCPTKLAFSKKEHKEDGFLDFFEILALKLKNELTVLSSCKSGLTTQDVPVGSINLGWAFNQAGSRSVLVSLWDANDYASSVIMPEFYRNLKNGMTRPEALRHAKIKYLSQADGLMKHPFYWAGFQYYGKNEPVNMLDTNRLNYTGTVIVLLLIGLFLIGARIMMRKFLKIF